ncbi:MAG: BPSS1780 family membrane protein [Saprospiraceae bacterium]
MNSARQEKLNDLIENGYDFDITKYISRGYRIFKEEMGLFVGYTVFFIVIAMFSSAIPIVGSMLFSLFLSPMLLVGYYIMANKIDRREPVEFSDFFKGFDFFKPIVLIALVSMVISLLCFSPYFQSYLVLMGGQPDAIANLEFSPAMLLCFIPILYFAISWMWAPMLVVFEDMPFWDAMEMSRRLITRNWISVFVFYVLCGILAGLGVIAFCIGMFFTIPIFYCAIYASYADVTQLSKEDLGLERHLID